MSELGDYMRGERPILDRKTSSPAMLAQRVRAYAIALREGDESLARAELVSLGHEVRLLSQTHPISDLAGRRLEIAAGKEPTGPR